MSRATEAGFSLVEMLVALAVLSFGVLGMLGLLTEALGEMRSARLQNEAVEITADLVGRLQSNAAAGQGPSGLFAAAELAEWRSRVARSLPEAEAELETRAASELIEQTLEISWADPGRGRRTHGLSLIVSASR